MKVLVEGNIGKITSGAAILAVVMFAFFVMEGCGKKAEEAKKEDTIPVRVSKVKLQELYQTLDYGGDIKAQEEALVYPKVSGKIIEKVKEDGAPIEKGETLAYIDRDEVGFKFEKAPVQSPLSGLIGRVYVDIGSSVNPQTAVALVVDADNVKINLDIPEKYISKISIGQKAHIKVDTYPEEEFKGYVSKISPVVDTVTRTAPIEILTANTGQKLNTGMFARVSLIIGERRNVPVIMKEAIMGKGEELYLYVVEGEKAFLRKISLGIRQGPLYEVKEGVKEGDLVVIMGQQRLRDGAEVYVENGE